MDLICWILSNMVFIMFYLIQMVGKVLSRIKCDSFEEEMSVGYGFCISWLITWCWHSSNYVNYLFSSRLGFADMVPISAGSVNFILSMACILLMRPKQSL